ncbi:hypothetical protein [Mucilaginibacter flavus]|uniref:hypothetical protein n=1 Tax=Mucilaginibacter flavus TaxID=931504 RepID=UPI0025B49D68|nr:hypothetical protein [Mucilaginibacter flavus]MDN3581690.1 hypothetical protein [Mucilaginibacter flavus]
MKKFTCFLMVMLCGTRVLHAQSVDQKLQVAVSSGYQQENFRWSISGSINGQNPNVLSELKWMKVGGQNATAAISWNFYRRFAVYADYSRQFISTGTVNDSDYGSDNRTNRTYNETFSANKGNTQLWHLGAGYVIFNNDRFSLTPYIGYAQSKENLRLLGSPNSNPGLNSSYAPYWKGGFLKLNSTVKLINKLAFKADVTYHQLSYTSNGDWNLITSFKHPVSYHHNANGYGINAGGRLNYRIISYLAVYVGGTYFNWQTGNGTDQLYLNSGEVDKTQLNEVKRNGFEVYGGLSISY